jgi:adhesin transport system outer membrane protein
LIGAQPPPGLMRAPEPGTPAISREMAEYLARTSPAVEAAQERSRAAYNDSRASKADRLPRVVAGVDAGQYGLFRDREGEDYDVRARVSVQQRFFAGTFARADADVARADAARARALGLEQEAVREAVIAWADMQALDDQLAALSENYIASRRTRDVLAERFFYARGSLFDVLQAEDNYFAVAGNYIQALTERDSARYVLLARTGRLLEALAIPTQESAE